MLGTMDSYVQRNSNKFYNRANKHSHRDIKGLIFRAEAGLQSAELNELQDYQFKNFSEFSKSIYTNGTLLKGEGVLSINKPAENDLVSPIVVKLEAAELFNEGIIVKVPQLRKLLVPQVGTYDIGVLVTTNIINENTIFKNDSIYKAGSDVAVPKSLGEDDKYGLRDPAEGSRNYNEAGAHRIDISGKWVMADAQTASADNEEFFPIYKIIDSVLQVDNKANVAPESIAAQEMVAKYDRTSNGSFVLKGMVSQFKQTDKKTGEHIISISDGYARVDGYEVTFRAAQNTRIAPNTATMKMDEESHTLVVAGIDGSMQKKYNLRHSPLRNVVELTYSVKNSENRTFSNLSYALDKTNIQEILSVTVGNTTLSTDEYKRVNDQLVFESNNSLTAGDTFEVIYLFKKTVYDAEIKKMISYEHNGDSIQIRDDYNGDEPIWFGNDDADKNANTVPELEISYYFYIPRKDRIYINKNAEIIIAEGNASRLNPVAPVLAEGLSIATVELLSGQTPIISVEFYRAFQMSDIQKLFSRIDALEYNLAKLTLIENANSSEYNHFKKSLFVDPFVNDDMIDKGAEQHHLMSKGLLTHAKKEDSVENIAFTPETANWTDAEIWTNTRDIMLPHIGTIEMVKQRYWTNARNINEFNWNTEEIDTTVTLTPALHSFITTDYEFDSVIEQTNYTGWSFGRGSHGTTTTRTKTGTSFQDVEGIVNLPSNVAVGIYSTYFDANEDVEVYFDDKEMAGEPSMIITANAFGTVAANFVVPAGTTSGIKIFKLKGTQSGVEGTNSFTLSAQAEQDIFKVTINRWWSIPNDPVAETFVWNNSGFLRTADIYFTDLPAHSDETDRTPVYMFLVETVVGFPDRNKVLNKVETTIGEIRKYINAKNDGTGNFKFRFENPTYITKDIEYAFVVDTTNSDLSVRTARVGRTDSHNHKHINTQPYNKGIFLNSSNSSTWTPIQNEDMAFGLWAANYLEPGQTTRSREFVLKTQELTNVTNFIFLATTQIFKNTNIEFTAQFDNSIADMQIYPYEPITIPSFTGKMTIVAKLTTSDATVSPIINRDMNLITHTVRDKSNYITKTIPANQGDNLSVYMDLLDVDVVSQISVEYRLDYRNEDEESILSDWVPITNVDLGETNGNGAELILKAPKITYDKVDDKLVENQYKKAGMLQVQITLTANPAKIHRVFIQNLRLIMT